MQCDTSAQDMVGQTVSAAFDQSLAADMYMSVDSDTLECEQSGPMCAAYTDDIDGSELSTIPAEQDVNEMIDMHFAPGMPSASHAWDISSVGRAGDASMTQLFQPVTKGGLTPTPTPIDQASEDDPRSDEIKLFAEALGAAKLYARSAVGQRFQVAKEAAPALKAEYDKIGSNRFVQDEFKKVGENEAR